MRMFVSAVCFATLTACASQSPDASTPQPAGDTSQKLSSETTPALDVLKQGGAFVFALDESDPAKAFHDQCNAQSGGDSAKADACYAAAHEEGGHEFIRFSSGTGGQIVWTSYGMENGKEDLYLEIPLAVTTDGDHAVVGRAAGVARGRQAGNGVFPPNKLIRFEVVGASTVAMIDPQKGRLVFHRAP